MSKNNLKMFTANGGEWDPKEEVLHINSPHLLTQIAGYAKFKLGISNTAVYFRGQGAKYDTMKAGLYRISEKHNMATIHRRHEKLNKYIKTIIENEAVLNGTPERVVEPLLQHYGLKTRWIDFVDNIWIALWFSCHRYLSCGENGRFAHFERKSEGDGSKHAYIEIAGFSDLIPLDGQPGFAQNATYEFCDLRIASPSLYIRPHAQHGVMVRRRKVSDPRLTNCADCLFGTIRMTLRDALRWLGYGELLSVHSLFPPPYYDFGYRLLLEKAGAGEKNLGSITFIGS